jgi:Ca2+:H+ antiporter
MTKYFNVLLIFAPVAIAGEFLGWSPTIVFWSAALAVIPLAGILGEATEELAAHTGPQLSGFLNGTLGNAAELIITIFAIKAGLLDLVKASITGSILGNLLLVLGLSILLGGVRHGVQKFDRTQASVNATMLFLALIALGIPSLFSHSIEETNHAGVEYLSLGTAALIAASAARDGESNWLEGAQLLVVYVIIGLAFFYLPM